MSTFRLGVVLRNLACLGIAGAAGFAFGRVDPRATSPSDYELLQPQYAAAATSAGAPWYPTVVLHPGNDPPAAGEEVDKGRAVLLPDGSVLVLDRDSRDKFEV